MRFPAARPGNEDLPGRGRGQGPDTGQRRATTRIHVLLALALPLEACHVSGHLPPGQLKKAFAPPPGHGGIPPGQLKKY